MPLSKVHFYLKRKQGFVANNNHDIWKYHICEFILNYKGKANNIPLSSARRFHWEKFKLQVDERIYSRV